MVSGCPVPNWLSGCFWLFVNERPILLNHKDIGFVILHETVCGQWLSCPDLVVWLSWVVGEWKTNTYTQGYRLCTPAWHDRQLVVVVSLCLVVLGCWGKNDQHTKPQWHWFGCPVPTGYLVLWLMVKERPTLNPQGHCFGFPATGDRRLAAVVVSECSLVWLFCGLGGERAA